nr:tetratricopeptide repeat protein [Coleofasciculus sp. LEGE 07081]
MFLDNFAQSLNQPSSSPVLFQVWGIGGVGKTTLLKKLQELHQQEADFAAVSFGYTMGIETPLKLMAELYQQLPKPPNLLQRDVRELFANVDSFTPLYQNYQETAHQLETQSVDGKKSVDSEQLKLVKQLFNAGVSTVGQVVLPGIAAATLGKASEVSVDAATMILSEKDRIQNLLQQHQATKRKKELQELMLDPLPKLTQAFVEGLIQQAKKRPLILILDTYEKAPSEIDFWLCHYLLGNRELAAHNVRIVVAGRFNILKTEYWRKLQQDRDLVYEQCLERFDQERTADYLQQVGITEPGQVEEIYQATKGLPYYLNWIRREKEAGREIDFSQGNQEIVNLLLQGLNPTQKQILQLAACCHWFDKGLISYLMSDRSLDFDTAADNSQNCFDWLKQRDFVEFAQHRHRLDDVARDVFRLSLWQEDKEQFYQVHGVLADYFKEQADRDVPPDSPPPMLYNNSDWRELIAEFLYHSVFSRRSDTQRQLIAYLFTSRYFQEDEVVRIPVQAILSEADLADKCLLNDAMWQFIEKIQPAVEYGWEVSEEKPINWEFLETNGFSKSQIEATLRTCFNPINALDGLAKFAALLYKSKRCPETQRVDWVQQAEAQAELIVTPDDAEFSSGLFLWDVGNSWDDLGRREEAVVSYDKAIEFKPDYHQAWYNRGIALGNLGRLEEELASYDKAIEFKPDYHQAWCNRGYALGNLGRLEEELASYDKAIEFKPDLHQAWYNRGYALGNLGRLEEELASYDKAIEFKPDLHQAWNNRGYALNDLGRLEEAVASYDKALEIKPDETSAFYNKACTYAKHNNIDLAIENLQQAINLNPDKYREMAKTDSDFDPIRSDNQFQALIQGRTD